jgi:hypothetical protein
MHGKPRLTEMLSPLPDWRHTLVLPWQYDLLLRSEVSCDDSGRAATSTRIVGIVGLVLHHEKRMLTGYETSSLDNLPDQLGLHVDRQVPYASGSARAGAITRPG